MVSMAESWRIQYFIEYVYFLYFQSLLELYCGEIPSQIMM